MVGLRRSGLVRAARVADPTWQEFASPPQPGIGRSRHKMIVDALQVAHKVKVERAGFGARHEPPPQALEMGLSGAALQVAEARLFGRQKPRKPAFSAARSRAALISALMNTDAAERRLALTRSKRALISALPSSEKASPRFRRLAASDIRLRSTMSPACSRCVVKARIARTRSSSASLSASGSSWVT